MSLLKENQVGIRSRSRPVSGSTERPGRSSDIRLARPILYVAICTFLAVIAACGTGDVTDSNPEAAQSPSPATSGPEVVVDLHTAAPETETDVAPDDLSTSGAPTASAPPSETPTPTPEPACRVNISALNMREGPSTRYNVIGAALQNTEIVVTERLADCSWLFGRVGAASGWVATAFLSCPFDACSLPIVQSNPPTYTPSPTPTPTPTLPPAISLTADRTEVGEGECTSIRWNVANAEAVTFEGDTVAAQGSQEVCPEIDTEYTLGWTHANGLSDSAVISILIEGISVPGGIPIILPTPDGFPRPIIDPGLFPLEPIRAPGRLP